MNRHDMSSHGMGKEMKGCEEMYIGKRKFKK